jgi:Transposase zinc-binding domain
VCDLACVWLFESRVVVAPVIGGSDDGQCITRRKTAAYQRHEPEKTVLYKIVSENLETFLSEVSDHYDKPLPRYVEKELRDFLACGLLQHGFLRAACKECGRTILVAFSCKKRGICPLCFVVAQLIDITGKQETSAAGGIFSREFNGLRCVARQWWQALRNIIRVGLADQLATGCQGVHCGGHGTEFVW